MSRYRDVNIACTERQLGVGFCTEVFGHKPADRYTTNNTGNAEASAIVRTTQQFVYVTKKNMKYTEQKKQACQMIFLATPGIDLDEGLSALHPIFKMRNKIGKITEHKLYEITVCVVLNLDEIRGSHNKNFHSVNTVINI